MNRNRKNLLFYIASALIPFTLLLAALAYTGAVPFGDNSILWRDAQIQYVDFAAYLRTMLRGENDFLYSFNKNLGGEVVSLLSYYLASPFNLLFAFASDEMLPMVFTMVAVLKISLCGLTFFHGCTRLYGCKGIHLAFSTAYALMAYNVLFGWCIMWLDGVLVLPLLGLGLYELWSGKKPWLYIVSLAYGLFTNFYIGYMLCIASVLFSLVHMVMMTGDVRVKAKTFGKFLAASCLGGFASAILWVPAFLALLEGRATVTDAAPNILINFNILGLAGKVVAGAASPAQIGSGTPHIFCGILTLLLVMVFLLNRGIDRKVRLASFGVLAVLLVSFILRPLNIVWHGFSPNYAFNFRYSFIFSYVMLMIARYALTRMDSVRKWELGLASSLIALLIGALLVVRGILDLEFLSIAGCITSLAVLAMVFAALTFAKGRSAICAVLVLASILEMGVNCAISWNAVTSDPDMEQIRLEEYNAFHQRLAPAVEYVKAADDGFYRMEKTLYYDMNDPMFFGFNGLSHFSSSQQKHVLGLLEKMGLKNDRDICVYYRTGSTAGTDSLFGVKYVLSEADLSREKGYEKLQTINGIGIYRNPNALSVAFLTRPEVLDVQLDNPDYFALHNAIWHSVSGLPEPVLHKAADVKVKLNNLFTVPAEEGNIRYIREDQEAPASICYEITIDREMPLYYYFTSFDAQDADIYVNGAYHGYYFHELRWDMTNAGVFTPGQTVEIRLELLSGQITLKDALFYYEDTETLATHAQSIRGNPVTLFKESSSRLSGSFTAQDDQLLMFTIPYDTGWTLYVDGQPCPYTQVLDSLMAASVPAGEHTYELRFVPKGGFAGCVLTVTALVGCIVWYVLERKKGVSNGKKA